MSEPSVLAYARYFELTQDHSLHDPLTALDTTLVLSRRTAIVGYLDQSVDELVKSFEKAARQYVSLENNDSSTVSEDAASYLESCTNHTIEDMRRVYDELLPDPHRIRKFKLDLPLLVLGGGDVERDVKKIKRGVDPQLVLDDFVDDEEDEKSRSKKYEPPTSSTVSAEILELSRTQLEVALKEEKLDVSMETMKFIREALSTSIEPSDMPKIMFDLIPKIADRGSIDIGPITEEAFEVEDETDTVESPGLPASEENYNEELPSVIKRELDMLGRLNAALDGEQFLQNTQADREMDELFQQFTHHDSDGSGRNTVDPIEDRIINDIPEAKRRKLVHEDDSEIVSYEIAENDPQDLQTGLEEYKIKIPHIPGYHSFGLPVLDLRSLSSQGHESRTFVSKALDPGPLPFRIPTVHEAICESMPAQLQVTDKLPAKEKPVISSDMLLWKEPGLRILDHNDEDDEDVDVDDYQIEESKPNIFIAVQPDSAKRPTNAYLFDASGHRKGTDGADHNSERQEVRASPINIKLEPMSNVYSKQESSPMSIAPPRSMSDLVLFNPFARAKARVKLELERPSRDAVKDGRPGSIIREQELCGSSEQSDEHKDKRSKTQSCSTGIRSLLPENRRNYLVPPAGMKDRSVLNDSMSSFLDLRGKQFKLPVVKRVCEVVEMIEDPITSTQGSLAEEWFSDELTLTPTTTQPVQSIQKEVIPPITPLDEPRTIVINSTLLQTKPLLIQFLEDPDTTNLILIYRDFDTKQYRGPDLILNTTTCLFITNLQSLNQRPLPGQKSATGLSSAHDRVAGLACPYSQVIVLVHHATSTEGATRSKTASTQASFAAFCQNFIRTTPPNVRGVQPFWIPCVDPGSTSNIINAWVWQIVDRHAYRNGDPKSPQPGHLARPILIQEETLWELFLCKAGMNPLAAQVVISSLKRSVVQGKAGMDPNDIWGLRRLVAMDFQERKVLFDQTIGVDVVERLTEVLNSGSKSARRT